MRVVILGGYGVFGSRLAELLLRDGHDVWIVGRSLEKAQALAARIGGHSMVADARVAPDAIFDCNRRSSSMRLVRSRPMSMIPT
jgi:nucleoside-diphosphate-sugar epimerase